MTSVPTTVRFHEVGGLDVIRPEVGDIGRPGPGEVRLTIDAIGLNRAEAAFRGGQYIVKPTLPSLLGTEACGRIAEIGADVAGWRVGDRVIAMALFPVAIELGVHWLGPLADALDMWAAGVFARRLAPSLSMKPSDYIARNVRVTPFNIVEPIELYFTRYPHLARCFCFSTDYPHVEGGKDIRSKVEERLRPLGADVDDGYLRGNARLPFN